VRPEAFEDAALAPPDAPRLEVEVAVLEELGSDAHVFFYVNAPRASSELLEASEGEETTLLVEEKALFNARVDSRTEARVQGTMELAVDPTRFHFFDPKTRSSLVGSGAPPVEVPQEPLAPAGR
jgi:multiple sugar transport system ATP-binding protein